MINKPFNRRRLLRGTGALISLPALQSIGFPRFASAAPVATPPKRMVFLGFGFGVTQETWFPKLEQTGSDYELPEGLAPLAHHKKDFTVVQGCSNQFSSEAHWGSTFWLTGANRYAVPRQSMFNSVLVDQVAAKQLGQGTRFASLQLASADASSSGHGPGLSLARDQYGKPVAGIKTPVDLFHKLFSAPDLRPLFDLMLNLRPKEELYDLRRDPDRQNNVANDDDRAKIRSELWTRPMSVLEATGDPRLTNAFDQPPYVDNQRGLQ